MVSLESARALRPASSFSRTRTRSRCTSNQKGLPCLPTDSTRSRRVSSRGGASVRDPWSARSFKYFSSASIASALAGPCALASTAARVSIRLRELFQSPMVEYRAETSWRSMLCSSGSKASSWSGPALRSRARCSASGLRPRSISSAASFSRPVRKFAVWRARVSACTAREVWSSAAICAFFASTACQLATTAPPIRAATLTTAAAKPSRFRRIQRAVR